MNSSISGHIVYRRTDAGERATLGGATATGRALMLLRMFDGRTAMAELTGHLRHFDTSTIVAALLDAGLIEAVDHGGGRDSRMLGRRFRLGAEHFGETLGQLLRFPAESPAAPAAADPEPETLDETTRLLRLYAPALAEERSLAGTASA